MLLGLDVAPYYVFAHVPNASHVKRPAPQVAAPQVLLECWMLLEQRASAGPFERVGNHLKDGACLIRARADRRAQAASSVWACLKPSAGGSQRGIGLFG